MIQIFSFGGKTYLFVNGREGCVDTERLRVIVETIAFELLKHIGGAHEAA